MGLMRVKSVEGHEIRLENSPYRVVVSRYDNPNAARPTVVSRVEYDTEDEAQQGWNAAQDALLGMNLPPVQQVAEELVAEVLPAVEAHLGSRHYYRSDGTCRCGAVGRPGNRG